MHNKTGEVLFQVKQAESDADRLCQLRIPSVHSTPGGS